MKPLTIFIFAGVSVLLLLSCEDQETKITPDPQPPPPSLNFEAFFTGKNPTVNFYGVSDCGSGFRHEFRGEGDSDLLGPFTIVKRYCFANDDAAPFNTAVKYSHIENGEFTLTAKERGDTIVGTYYGDVSTENGYSIFLEKFTINGGTGKYHNATGNLSVNSSGSEQLTGRISGRIRVESSPVAFISLLALYY